MKTKILKQIVKDIIIVVLIVGIPGSILACSNPQNTQQSTSPVSGSSVVNGMASEIVGPNISLKTTDGRPLVLKIDANTKFLKLDGSSGTKNDIRPGMNVKISYDSSTMVCQSVQVQ